MNATSPNATVPLRGNRFLIVGGASLVGSATAELLLAEGAGEVTILDNFFQGTGEAIAISTTIRASRWCRAT